MDPAPFHRPRPAPKPPPLHPRRVRGGIKLPGGAVEGPAMWAAQRWLRIVEQAAAGDRLVEGLEYAKLGQTKRLTLGHGKAEATVQGRAERAYTTAITVQTIPDSAWQEITATMGEGAIYAAKLLAGELPTNIEDAFAPRGLKLFPSEPAEVGVSCTCADYKAATERPPVTAPIPETPLTYDPRWCKHVCCLSYLLAQRLANEPLLIFALRGLEGRELLERLRELRSSAGVGPGERSPVYIQHVQGVADSPQKPLEQCLANFWDAGPGLNDIEIPLDRPVISHLLLRRLGPSPFQAPFPLVGLLASCYESISEAALRSGETLPPPASTE